VEAARAERHAETLSRVTAIFRQAVESAGERYEEGDLSLYDRRRIEVERVRYESSLADAVLDLSLARRELALLVAPQADDLQLAPADPSVGMPPAMNLDRLQTLAVSRRPEVAAQEADMRSARAELSQARAQRVPDVTANGGLKRQSDGFSGLFLGMSVPIPMWNRSAGAIEAADARVSREETRLALARREIEEEARSTLEAYRSQMRRAEFLSEAGESSSFDLLDIAEVAYGAGEMELLGLLDAAEALRDAEMAEVRIQSDLWISYYDLERAVGGF
jgi:cobalt-zinc-cadmium efflux system outer membrane protein